MVGWDLGGCFCDDPILGSAGYFVCADFYESSAFDREEVARGKDFDVDDGENAVIDVVGVYFTGDDFFTLVVDFFYYIFVDNG